MRLAGEQATVGPEEMSGFPSEEQRRVIDYRGARLVVVAAPGTGKSRTIVKRMINLLSEDPNRVISFLTFTRASRRDTYNRVKRTVGSRAVDAAVAELPRITTLHTFAKSLVHRHHSTLGRDSDFSVLVSRQGEKELIISEVIEDLSFRVKPAVLDRALVHLRSTGAWPADTSLSDSQRQEAAATFEALLRFYNSFDMEGIVPAACVVLSNQAVDVPRVFLQVDEYQDLNPTDQKFVDLASQTEGSQIVVVGDDTQSIYGWRYANPGGLRHLWDAENWDRVRFEECHRLPSHVVRAALGLVSNHEYLGAQVRVPEDDGKRIAVLRCTSDSLQIGAVASHIQELRRTARNSAGEALSYKDFMILCPTGNQVERMALGLDESFQVPTRRRQRVSIPESIWRILLVLRMLGSDSLALRQWLKVARIPRKRIRAVRRQAMNTGGSLYDFCSNLTDPGIAQIYSSLDRLRQSLPEPGPFSQALAQVPLMEADESALSAISEIAVHTPAVGRMIADIYTKFGVLDPDDEQSEAPDEDAVLVTTMHAAKGLEAEFVYISWLNARFMPNPSRVEEEERRVLYVALTRAKQDVVLTFHEQWDKNNRRRLKDEAMSPFLRAIRVHLDMKPVSAKDVTKPQTATYARAP